MPHSAGRNTPPNTPPRGAPLPRRPYILTPTIMGLLLLLIRHGSGTVTITVTVDAFLHVTTVTVPDEDARSFSLENEAFSDVLGTYEVRLYSLR